uniref:Uncharacterized protein n=1 Tax=Triticum urartu TaxID=4572 RepID=A0A8R7PDE3_TRIUA
HRRGHRPPQALRPRPGGQPPSTSSIPSIKSSGAAPIRRHRVRLRHPAPPAAIVDSLYPDRPGLPNHVCGSF